MCARWGPCERSSTPGVAGRTQPLPAVSPWSAPPAAVCHARCAPPSSIAAPITRHLSLCLALARHRPKCRYFLAKILLFLFFLISSLFPEISLIPFDSICTNGKVIYVTATTTVRTPPMRKTLTPFLKGCCF